MTIIGQGLTNEQFGVLLRAYHQAELDRVSVADAAQTGGWKE